MRDITAAISIAYTQRQVTIGKPYNVTHLLLFNPHSEFIIYRGMTYLVLGCFFRGN